MTPLSDADLTTIGAPDASEHPQNPNSTTPASDSLDTALDAQQPAHQSDLLQSAPDTASRSIELEVHPSAIQSEPLAQLSEPILNVATPSGLDTSVLDVELEQFGSEVESDYESDCSGDNEASYDAFTSAFQGVHSVETLAFDGMDDTGGLEEGEYELEEESEGEDS